MTYLRRSNAAGKRSRAKTIGIIAFLLFLFAIHYFFPRFYPALFYPVTSTIWRSENFIGKWLSYKASLARSKYSLIEENKRLTREISANQASMLLIQNLKKENEELKSAMERGPEGRSVLSVVLSRPPISPYDTLVIDAGTRDGISLGDKVYADGDVLIGEIAEVFSGESKVSLFSTPGKKTSVSFTNTNIHAEASGKGGGNFSVSVPFEAGIEEGDTVISPDIKLHTLGVVESVTTDKASSFAVILFKMPVNIHDIRFVEVQTGN